MDSRRSFRNPPRIASVVFRSHLYRLARKPFISSEENLNRLILTWLCALRLAAAVLGSFPSHQLQPVPNSFLFSLPPPISIEF